MKRRKKRRKNASTPGRNSKGRFVKKRKSNPSRKRKRKSNPKAKRRRRNAWKGNKAGHRAAAKAGWAKSTHKTRVRVESAGRKIKSGKRRKKRTTNASYARTMNRRRAYRRKNPVTITLDFTRFQDALPATIAGTVGFIAAGVVDAIAQGKVSEGIAKMFAGKDASGQARPLDYKAKAQGRAVLDIGTFFLIWGATSYSDMLKPYRTPAMIGAGIRGVRSIFDAILDPKPDTISAGLRRVMALPSVQTKPIVAAAQIPGKLKLVTYDPAKKKYVDPAGAVVEITFLPTGVATATTGGEVLVDSATNEILMQSSSHALGSTYEEWDLVLNGAPSAGYQPGQLNAYEDWSESMGAYEDWSQSLNGAPSAGYQPGQLNAFEDWQEAGMGGAYDDAFDAPF